MFASVLPLPRWMIARGAGGAGPMADIRPCDRDWPAGVGRRHVARCGCVTIARGGKPAGWVIAIRGFRNCWGYAVVPAGSVKSSTSIVQTALLGGHSDTALRGQARLAPIWDPACAGGMDAFGSRAALFLKRLGHARWPTGREAERGTPWRDRRGLLWHWRRSNGTAPNRRQRSRLFDFSPFVNPCRLRPPAFNIAL